MSARLRPRSFSRANWTSGTVFISQVQRLLQGDQWVTLEVEVRGSEKVIHRVNGVVVMEYQYPQKDDGTLLGEWDDFLTGGECPYRVSQD